MRISTTLQGRSGTKYFYRGVLLGKEFDVCREFASLWGYNIWNYREIFFELSTEEEPPEGSGWKLVKWEDDEKGLPLVVDGKDRFTTYYYHNDLLKLYKVKSFWVRISVVKS